MCPLTAEGKNLMLNALRGTNPTTPITHVGLFTKQADRNPTGAAATEIFTDNGHGYANGDVVMFSALTGGTGLAINRVYYVIGAAANTYQLSLTAGGAAVNFTTDVTAATVARYVEISGGAPAYARLAIAFNAPAEGAMDDSTNGALFDVPAGAQVDAVGYHSASTAGTLLGLDGVTQEVFAAQGQYNLTDADIDLNASDTL